LNFYNHKGTQVTTEREKDDAVNVKFKFPTLSVRRCCRYGNYNP